MRIDSLPWRESGETGPPTRTLVAPTDGFVLVVAVEEKEAWLGVQTHYLHEINRVFPCLEEDCKYHDRPLFFHYFTAFLSCGKTFPKSTSPRSAIAQTLATAPVAFRNSVLPIPETAFLATGHINRGHVCSYSRDSDSPRGRIVLKTDGEKWSLPLGLNFSPSQHMTKVWSKMDLSKVATADERKLR